MEISKSSKRVRENQLHEADILRNPRSLSSVIIFPFVFDKAIFQYSVHNSKSLIAMLSNKNTIDIFITQEIFGK